MRIGYFTNQYPAPSHTFIRREINALETRGNAVVRYAIRPAFGQLVDADDVAELRLTRHILSLGAFRLLIASLWTLLERPRTSYHAFKLTLRFASTYRGNLLRHIAYFLEALVLARWCLNDGIQHLHVHFGTNPATIAAIAHTISGVPFSVTVHGPEEFDHPAALGLGIKAELATFTVAVSSFGRSQLMRWTALTDWGKLQVVRCGIDSSYADAIDIAPISTENRFICIARLSEQKGHLLLLRAAAKLAQEGLDFHLVFAGDGPLRQEIENEIDRLSLRNVVTLLGSISQEHVRAEVLRAKAMVLASFAEGLPVVLMESMALKRPAITTYIAGIPELVLPGSGWLVPAGDIDGLVNAMRSALFADQQTLEQMGDRARRLALAMHDVAASAAALEALIEESVSNAASAR